MKPDGMDSWSRNQNGQTSQKFKRLEDHKVTFVCSQAPHLSGGCTLSASCNFPESRGGFRPSSKPLFLRLLKNQPRGSAGDAIFFGNVLGWGAEESSGVDV